MVWIGFRRLSGIRVSTFFGLHPKTALVCCGSSFTTLRIVVLLSVFAARGAMAPGGVLFLPALCFDVPFGLVFATDLVLYHLPISKGCFFFCLLNLGKGGW